MKKKILISLLITALLLAGMALILYPAVSNKLAERYHIAEIENYDEIIAEMAGQAKAEEFRKAREYNAALIGNGIEDPFMPGSGAVLPDNYTAVLDIDNTVMGYIEIPAIKIYLPIFHGTSEDVLRKGIGHMENTAFPIGGRGNHSVLTGHTGFSSEKLFTDLDKVEKGNYFYITVLDRTIAYEIDRILVITPDNTEDLVPIADEDYVTLITCTPYAINSHRLLVRGTRIPYEAAVQQPPAGKAGESVSGWRTVLIISAVILISVMFTAFGAIRWRRLGGVL